MENVPTVKGDAITEAIGEATLDGPDETYVAAKFLELGVDPWALIAAVNAYIERCRTDDVEWDDAAPAMLFGVAIGLRLATKLGRRTP